EEDGARSPKGPSIEEFVAYNMTHLGQISPVEGPIRPGESHLGIDAFDAGKAVDDLGLGYDADTGACLKESVKHARLEAEAARKEAAAIVRPTWQERVKEFKQKGLV